MFWDKECLARGVDWEKDFRRGLKRSCLYLPLISDAGLERVSYGCTLEAALLSAVIWSGLIWSGFLSVCFVCLTYLRVLEVTAQAIYLIEGSDW